MDSVLVVNAVAVLIGLAGMVSHWWKNKLKKQTLDSLKTYITGHPAYTIAAAACTAVACIAAAPAALADFASVGLVSALFTLGYTCDSLINKAVNDSHV